MFYESCLKHICVALISSTMSGAAIVNGSTSVETTDDTAVVAGIGTLILGMILVSGLVAAALFIVGRRQLQRRSWDARYRKLPTSDPAAPSIKIEDPQPPLMTYHTAMELPSSEKYPFIRRDRSPSPVPDKRRPPLVREYFNRRTKLPAATEAALEKCSHFPFEYSLRIPREKILAAAVQKSTVSASELSLTLVYVREECVLTVKVEKAVGLQSREDGSPADPYVRMFFVSKVPLQRQRRTSKTHAERKESAPVFGDVIRYDQMSPEELINSTMQIQILDYHPYGKHPLMAIAGLPLGQVAFENEVACLTLPLQLNKVRAVAWRRAHGSILEQCMLFLSRSLYIPCHVCTLPCINPAILKLITCRVLCVALYTPSM